MTSLTRWNRSLLYSSDKDPQIKLDIARLAELSLAFQKYRGTLRAKVSRRSLAYVKQAFLDYAVIEEIFWKLDGFCDLLGYELADKVDTFCGKVHNTAYEVSKSSEFFVAEIAHLGDRWLAVLINDPRFKEFRNWIIELRDSKDHYLPVNESLILTGIKTHLDSLGEKIIQRDLEETVISATELGGRKKMHIKGVWELMERHVSRAKRLMAYKALNRSLRASSPRATLLINSLGCASETCDDFLKYEDPTARFCSENQLARPVFDLVLAKAREHLPLFHAYLKDQKHRLGLTHLGFHDIKAGNMPRRKISFDQAKKIVIDGYGKCSQVLAAEASRIIRNHQFYFRKLDHIDSPLVLFGSSGTMPFGYVPFDGSWYQTDSLAHEMGHAINASLSRARGYYSFECNFLIAETMSTFGSLLLYDQIIEQGSAFKEKRTSLWDILRFVFLKIAHCQFELNVYARLKKDFAIDEPELESLWLASHREVFGNAVSLNQSFGTFWVYGSVFHTGIYSAPISYTFPYIFSQLVSLWLWNNYHKDGNKRKFVRRYLELNRAGSVASTAELLEPFGINLESPEFWDECFVVVKNLLIENGIPVK